MVKEDFILLRDEQALKEIGFKYSRRGLGYVHDTWGFVPQFDMDIAKRSGLKCALLEYDPGGVSTPPYVKVRIGDRVTKLPAIVARNFTLSGKKQFFSGIEEKPLAGYHKFTVIPSRGVSVGDIELKKHQAEKLMWYLIGYIGAETVFKKLASQLGYEIEE